MTNALTTTPPAPPRIIAPDISRPEILPHGLPRLVANDVKLGKGVRIHAYANLYGCSIGYGTTMGSMVEIQKGVTIGNRCKISRHSFIWKGSRSKTRCSSATMSPSSTICLPYSDRGSDPVDGTVYKPHDSPLGFSAYEGRGDTVVGLDTTN